MPHATEGSGFSTDTSSEPRRIILCFDGTGNSFQGNESDTNIVKIYQMLDRHKEGQFHYYQRELTVGSPFIFIITKQNWQLVSVPMLKVKVTVQRAGIFGPRSSPPLSRHWIKWLERPFSSTYWRVTDLSCVITNREIIFIFLVSLVVRTRHDSLLRWFMNLVSYPKETRKWSNLLGILSATSNKLVEMFPRPRKTKNYDSSWRTSTKPSAGQMLGSTFLVYLTVSTVLASSKFHYGVRPIRWLPTHQLDTSDMQFLFMRDGWNLSQPYFWWIRMDRRLILKKCGLPVTTVTLGVVMGFRRVKNTYFPIHHWTGWSKKYSISKARKASWNSKLSMWMMCRKLRMHSLERKTLAPMLLKSAEEQTNLTTRSNSTMAHSFWWSLPGGSSVSFFCPLLFSPPGWQNAIDRISPNFHPSWTGERQMGPAPPASQHGSPTGST